MPTTFLYTATLFGLLALILKTIYDVLTGPLRAVPGPVVSKWTNIILKYHVLIGRRLHYIHALHQKYGKQTPDSIAQASQLKVPAGSIVRISPSEVSISELKATKQIHSISGGFQKSPWYRNFADTTPVTFNMTDPKQYSSRRRLLAGELSETALRQHEDLVLSKVRLAVAKMAQETAELGYADVLKWWTFMATDVIGELSFGESFKMLELGEENDYSRLLKMNAVFSGIRAELRTLLACVAVLPIPFVRDVKTAGARMDAYAGERIHRYKSLAASSSAQRATLFSKLFKSHEGGGLSDEEVVGEARSYIIAGSDTTAVTLTYLVWAVARHASVQLALAEEVNNLDEDFVYEDLKTLSFMDHVISETLRLYGAAPASLPRMVPPGGRVLAGYYLAGGVTASTQAYTLHRDPQIFADPEQFKPSRWAEPTPEMVTAMMPFGGGSRTCLGIHLARMELRLAVAIFYRSCPHAHVSTKRTMNDSDMDMENYFLIAPRAHRCLMEVST